jgi:hypothetical protein
MELKANGPLIETMLYSNRTTVVSTCGLVVLRTRDGDPMLCKISAYADTTQHGRATMWATHPDTGNCASLSFHTKTVNGLNVLFDSNLKTYFLLA